MIDGTIMQTDAIRERPKLAMLRARVPTIQSLAGVVDPLEGPAWPVSIYD